MLFFFCFALQLVIAGRATQELATRSYEAIPEFYDVDGEVDSLTIQTLNDALTSG